MFNTGNGKTCKQFPNFTFDISALPIWSDITFSGVLSTSSDFKKHFEQKSGGLRSDDIISGNLADQFIVHTIRTLLHLNECAKTKS